MRVIINFKLGIFFSIITIAFGQNELENIPKNLPLHTKLFWGEKGLFRTLNLDPDNRQEELKLRMKMLQLHQKLALGTLGLFFYQTHLGNQLVKGKYEYQETHSTMSKVVFSSYMVTAGLSYFAPPAMKYSKSIDSMKIHRALSWIHFFGMASLPLLGYNISTSDDYDGAVNLHQNVAYLTLASLTFSGLLSLLPY